MRVETPQILWNSDGDKGKNAPLYSVALQESGVDSEGVFTHVLVTAGNTPTINLWRVSFADGSSTSSTCNGNGNGNGIGGGGIFQKATKPLTPIEYLTSLSRHDLPVNCVAFSPDGLHLLTAGEAGSIIVWSVPITKRGGGNGRHYWSTVNKESDLSVRIVSTHCEGVCDLSWSTDSKRFCVGTIDSNVLIYEDKHYSINQTNSQQKESEWHLVFRNGEHTAFVQGVAYDPLGVYIASMGSDRTVRIFPRKAPPKSKKKVLRPSNAPRIVSPPHDHQQKVAQLLTEHKLEMTKTKRIQRRLVHVDDDGAQIKQRLFVDESTCESFFRRLCWTTDGLFLITPCALWHQNHHDTTPSFSTYLFARHRFDEPYKVLPGLEKPSVVVRANPVLYELPESVQDESKENQALPYRSIFAVLTLDTVLIYDTHHDRPLAVAKGLHYAGLTDCCWSKDGRHLLVSSTDGYLSILSFQERELGKLYQPILPVVVTPELPTPNVIIPPEPTLPVSDAGPVVVVAPPTKKRRVTPILVAATKRVAEEVGEGVQNMTLETTTTAKKKKRIQPILVSNHA